MGRLDAAAAAGHAAEGATLLDLREPREFASGHPAGAINVPHDARHLEERVAKLVPRRSTLVLLARDADVAADAGRQLEAAFEVAGWSAPDEEAWRAVGAHWTALPTVESASLAAPDRGGYHVVDVREPLEWATGHVPDAQLIALGELRQRLSEIPRDRHLAVICEAGVRSSGAASLLRARGYGDVTNVIDGTAGYRRGGHPLQVTEPDEEDDA